MTKTFIALWAFFTRISNRILTPNFNADMLNMILSIICRENSDSPPGVYPNAQKETEGDITACRWLTEPIPVTCGINQSDLKPFQSIFRTYQLQLNLRSERMFV